MSAATGVAAGATGVRRSGWVVAAMMLCVAVFLWAVAQFYEPATGFSSLIKIGDQSNPKVTALREAPHYVYESSPGYDGAYYVQLALYPTLDNPELKKSIDNLPYRARRILFCWTAWALGLGKPAWIVQAHALLNVGCWLALAAVLWRWFPPTNAENFVRWFAVMFSDGMCASVSGSLVDGPSLLLVALAMARLEQGGRKSGIGLLALAGLGKETSLLAVAGVEADRGRQETGDRGQETQDRRQETGVRSWLRWGIAAIVVALPLLLWIGYVRGKFGPADDPGLGNFTAPLVGLAEQWGTVLAEFVAHPFTPIYRTALVATLAITVQFLFFALWRRPQLAWWRVGAMFATMMAFLSTPVWEGWPAGAFTRVLLPMTLAFNILVPRGRKWLAVLVLGNLSVLAGLGEFSPPARDFVQIGGESPAIMAVRAEAVEGWHGPETGGGERWRWTSGPAVLAIRNSTAGPLRVTLRGRAAGARDERRLEIGIGERKLWTGELSSRPVEFRFEFVAPPGETRIAFVTDKPAHPVGADPRRLAVKVADLEVVVQRESGQP